MFNYETDGLIFTPSDKSVGSDKTGEITAPKKRTWPRSLKWKPSEYNTIDFLVRVKKSKTGEDFIGNVFEDGDNLSETKQLNQYKTLILHVGFNEKFDGFIKDNIQIGGEFRIQSYDGQEESSIFPMQIDLYSNIEFNNDVSLFMKYGTKLELYVLLDDMLISDWIKIGKSMPNYGLKLDDHTSFIRGGNSSKTYVYSVSVEEGLVFDYAGSYEDPSLIEIGINKFSKWFWIFRCT